MPHLTILRTVDIHSPSPSVMEEAAACLLKGGLVAFPTETVYGLGANALDAEAVRKIFIAKQRPPNDPLIVHIAALEDLALVVSNVPLRTKKLMDAFWPGPLTLLFPRHAMLPEEVTSSLPTVAVRMPSHPVARALLQTAGVPIAAPSANRFGHTSPSLASHVLDDLDGRIDMVLDAGPATMGVESTVLDPNQTPPVILRFGGLPREQIESVIGVVRIANHNESPTASPGRMQRHYAPDARLYLCAHSDPVEIFSHWMNQSELLETSGHTVGWLGADEVIALVTTRRGKNNTWNLGNLNDAHVIARRLFAGIRTLEAEGVDCILAHMLPPVGLGAAINDRLLRASFLAED
jgi:L-threonylcarbamoyladenylate synthase